MRTRWLASLIYRFIRPSREPDFLIGPSVDDPYMRRWWIIPRNKTFNIYLHNMLHDDDDRAPHDHPWWSISLCLKGHIREHQLIRKEPTLTADGKSHHIYAVHDIFKGMWKYRSLTYTHRLELPEGEAWTLFITGPKVRLWGFHCPKGWKPWNEFVDPENPGNPGQGCGELE